jgi:endogenous inhibitor of DNA gyrase (YacG/DUF329 family)
MAKLTFTVTCNNCHAGSRFIGVSMVKKSKWMVQNTYIRFACKKCDNVMDLLRSSSQILR